MQRHVEPCYHATLQTITIIIIIVIKFKIISLFTGEQFDIM